MTSDGRYKMEDTAYIGPYKATRLWNDVVIAFRQYLPCGRHRRYMKTYDNCFSGASATEWLLQYLKMNGNFGSDVSREKATSLLNKLYRAGIFDEVRVSKSMRHKQDVHENRLYKFLPVSPSKLKITRLPLAPRNDIGVNHPMLKEKPSQHKNDFQEETKPKPNIECDVPEQKQQSKLVRTISILKRDKSHKETKVENEESYPPCHLITRVLTTREIKDTWKAAFILRSRKVLGVKNLDDVISPDLIDGYYVMHNCIYLNKSGIVTNIDAKDQLPHWVMSAMKCLARWPEPPEPGLPNYPGFEKDVFGVVKDYFLSQGQPLVPYSLYDVMTNVFVTAGSQQLRHSSPHHYDSASNMPSTLWSSASLENIILNLTKKYCLLDSTGNQNGTHEDLQVSSGWFGTQEDVRFADHVNQNSALYSQSTFPSTGEMNTLGQSHQASCHSLPGFQHSSGSTALSKTTQSARETTVRSDQWLSGISRKYGSTPNLKVSKYETVFGPDNRTVTRVFYQNGMTTDYGHDDEDGLCLQRGSGVNEINRAESANCLYDNDAALKRHTYVTEMPIARSKSFVDVKENTRNIPTDNIPSRTPGKSFSGTIVRSSSFNGNSNISQKQDNNNHSILVNSSKVAHCDADNKSFSALQQPEEPIVKASQNFLHAIESHHSDAASTLHKLSLPGALFAAAPQEQYPRESLIISHAENLNSSYCQSHPSQPRTSDIVTPYFSTHEKRVSPSPTRRPPSSDSYGPGYRHKHSEHYERPISSLDADDINNPTSSSAHDCIQEQKLMYDSTPPKQLSSSTLSRYGPGYRPSCKNRETDYNVVLDASKKRSVYGSTNLASLQHAPSCKNVQPFSSTAANQVTSTPYSPHCQDTATLKDLDYMPGLSFSNITPFYSVNSQSGTKTYQHSFMSYPQTRLSEDRVKNSLQMVTLLLPPANRRKLHLLFKMMMKMASNPNLCLDPTQTTRSLVLGAFYPAIIRPLENCDLDEVVQLQLVSFMLDFYDDILTPPSGIKTQVSDRLKALQRPQIVYSPKPERTVRFCQQASLIDFENQRASNSETALESLLENIVSDQNMNVKEKRKRLKQFQRTYPTIYSKRFPNAESEAKALPQKPIVKQPLMAKPLNKLRSLRL